MEFRALAATLAPEREVVRGHEVIATGWPGGAVIEENRGNWFLHEELRGKLEDLYSPVSIETVRGMEFRIT